MPYMIQTNKAIFLDDNIYNESGEPRDIVFDEIQKINSALEN